MSNVTYFGDSYRFMLTVHVKNSRKHSLSQWIDRVFDQATEILPTGTNPSPPWYGSTTGRYLDVQCNFFGAGSGPSGAEAPQCEVERGVSGVGKSVLSTRTTPTADWRWSMPAKRRWRCRLLKLT